LLAVACQEQQRTGQSFLNRVKDLIDQVLLDSDVPGQQVRDESGPRAFVLHADRESSPSLSITSTVVAVIAVAIPMRNGTPARHPSPKKSPGPNSATTASLPALIHYRQLYAALLNVHDVGSHSHPGSKFSAIFDTPSPLGLHRWIPGKPWALKARFFFDFVSASAVVPPRFFTAVIGPHYRSAFRRPFP
jgi:hypothetical protein